MKSQLLNIEAVILFCSLDERFFKTCVQNLLDVGIKCNVVTYTNLWKGEPEDLEVVDKYLNLFKDNPNFKHFRIEWVEGSSSMYWEALGRYYATHNMVESTCDYILYIDPDEIIDKKRFIEWLETGKYAKYKGMKFAMHTYSQSVHLQYLNKWYNTVMCAYDYAISLPFKIDARLQYFNNSNRISRWKAKLGINKKFFIYKGEPFIHHFTGIRKDLLKKYANWGHCDDGIDWVRMQQSTVIDLDNKVISNYLGKWKFKIVENKFNL